MKSVESKSTVVLVGTQSWPSSFFRKRYIMDSDGIAQRMCRVRPRLIASLSIVTR